ncbi:MAG: hypothetical protein HFI70_15350 [Lachnospiraceae bacterium]|nr:hypothetical protein [Lachnospiraceae bacterium]
MKVLNIFSWLPEKEISLEQLEQIFTDYKAGSYYKEYVVLYELPSNVTEDILTCKDELLKDGNNVAYILKDEDIIAVIGYKE